MRTFAEIDAIMQTIPEEWRARWCGGENGGCACLGCVQVGNRLVMAKEVNGREYQGDPEYIAEHKIPVNVYQQYKITRPEWDLWMAQSNAAKEAEK